MNLVIGKIYRDAIMDLPLKYMGKLGIEFNTDVKGRKGSYTFQIVGKKKPCHYILFNEKELQGSGLWKI